MFSVLPVGVQLKGPRPPAVGMERCIVICLLILTSTTADGTLVLFMSNYTALSDQTKNNVINSYGTMGADVSNWKLFISNWRVCVKYSL